MLLRKIFGPMREEVTGDWRKLCNEELHNLYWSPNDENQGGCDGQGILHVQERREMYIGLWWRKLKERD
jgi:hypothetical protein